MTNISMFKDGICVSSRRHSSLEERKAANNSVGVNTVLFAATEGRAAICL